MVADDDGYTARFHAERIERNCWVHAWRRLVDLHAAVESPIVRETLHRIVELDEIEQRGQALAADARQGLHRRQAQLKLTERGQGLETTRRTVADGSGTVKVLDYTLKRWFALIRDAESVDFCPLIKTQWKMPSVLSPYGEKELAIR